MAGWQPSTPMQRDMRTWRAALRNLRRAGCLVVGRPRLGGRGEPGPRGLVHLSGCPRLSRAKSQDLTTPAGPPVGRPGPINADKRCQALTARSQVSGTRGQVRAGGYGGASVPAQQAAGMGAIPSRGHPVRAPAVPRNALSAGQRAIGARRTTGGQWADPTGLRLV